MSGIEGAIRAQYVCSCHPKTGGNGYCKATDGGQQPVTSCQTMFPAPADEEQATPPRVALNLTNHHYKEPKNANSSRGKDNGVFTLVFML